MTWWWTRVATSRCAAPRSMPTSTSSRTGRGASPAPPTSAPSRRSGVAASPDRTGGPRAGRARTAAPSPRARSTWGRCRAPAFIAIETRPASRGGDVRDPSDVDARHDGRDDPVATLSAERVHAVCGDSEHRIETAAQQGTRAVETRLHGGLGHLEAGRGLGSPEAFEIAQHERHAVGNRQRFHGGLERARDLLRPHLLLRGTRRGGQGGRVLVEREMPYAVAPPRERFVEGDPCQPGGEARPAAELAKVGIRPHPGILRDVLGLALVSHHGPGRSIDAAVVSSHENLERPAIAGEHAGDDGVVSGRVRSGLSDLHRGQHVGPPPLMESRGPKRFPGTIHGRLPPYWVEEVTL